MNDWQADLKVMLDKMDKENQQKPELPIKVLPKSLRKKNHGRGTLPLLRTTPRTYHKVEIEDDGPSIHNWRRSPMER